jgi:hypothetical protein
MELGKYPSTSSLVFPVTTFVAVPSHTFWTHYTCSQPSDITWQYYMTHTNVFTQTWQARYILNPYHVPCCFCNCCYSTGMGVKSILSTILGHFKQCNSSDIQYHSSETHLFLAIITHMGQVWHLGQHLKLLVHERIAPYTFLSSSLTFFDFFILNLWQSEIKDPNYERSWKIRHMSAQWWYMFKILCPSHTFGCEQNNSIF